MPSRFRSQTIPIFGETDVFQVRRIYCIGRNYAAHAIERGSDPTREPPFFFQKPTDAIQNVAIGAVADHPYPSLTKNYHHEVELVLRICKEGKNIQEKFADKYYDAIGVGIDFTARDLQQKAKEKGLPWDIAKGFNGSAPVSDKFIPIGDFKDLKNINFSLKINEELKQQGNTSFMLFSFDYIISYLSKFFTLRTGDLIFTGTPKGVGPIKVGDVLSASVENEKLLEFEVK
jgi:2-keto-4-pentenoate hydratase/2-oxohepta-3-ene-1,7-dioic acid hydratase in catechol pathway